MEDWRIEGLAFWAKNKAIRAVSAGRNCPIIDYNIPIVAQMLEDSVEPSFSCYRFSQLKVTDDASVFTML